MESSCHACSHGSAKTFADCIWHSSHIGEELCALFCTPSKVGKIIDISSQDPTGAKVCYDEKDILGCKVIRRVLPFVKCYEQIKSSADTA